MPLVPEEVQRLLLSNLVHLVSCVMIDVSLSMQAELVLCHGHFRAGWSEEPTPEAYGRLRERVTHALARVDLSTIDAEVAKLAATPLPHESSLLKMAVLIALTYFHVYSMHSGASVAGFMVRASLTPLKQGKVR
mmetsp:Transcript_19888/g.63317  ORF Transcript_19888/g.63317 Transcript_19888/m.63317 type:complete len:134 (+) Transcript_19888:439-840(+)